MPFPLGLALAGVGALGKLTTGIFQGIKANKIDKQNVRPVQTIQNEYLQNVSDAEQAARMGMPLQQYQQAQQNQQRNFKKLKQNRNYCLRHFTKCGYGFKTFVEVW